VQKYKPGRVNNMDASTKQFKTIDEYINSAPEEVRGLLQTIRQTIKEEAPEAEETIKYRMPTFMFHGNLVFFAAFKKHIGFYPIPSAMEAFKEELSHYKTAKGSIQFPLDQPLPLPLIRKIVQFRMEENINRSHKA
jgi:uncharacterized protein YdhG (YjbR/CyaY superfamily)